MEISEQTAIETARSIRQSIEQGVRWMCHVSAERELFVFARVVAALWLLSYVGSFCDSLSLLYIGKLITVSLVTVHEHCVSPLNVNIKRVFN